MPPVILTYSRRRLDLSTFHPGDVYIEDIAHALACCNRFAGHAERPLTVAQHSVYVARIAEASSKSRAIGLQGLLHDASEAYIGDVTKWLKATPDFDGYRKLEETIQECVYAHFGLPSKNHEHVAYADKLMLRFEGRHAFGRATWSTHLEYIDYFPVTKAEEEKIGKWKPWSWKVAEEVYLAEFRRLTGVV